MYYKKFFLATSLVMLLGLSNNVFSDPVASIDDEEDSSYYIRLQYNGEFSPFKTEIKGIDYTKNNSKVSPLKSSFISSSGAFGYKMDDIRIDVEGLYSQLNKNKVDGAISNPEISETVSLISGLINVYYDIEVDDIPITPYVGAGVGLAYIGNPLADDNVKDQKKFGFAWQAKAGVSYDISQEIKFFAGARHFGSYGASFDKDNTVEHKNKGEVKIFYSTIGGEAGFSFNF